MAQAARKTTRLRAAPGTTDVTVGTETLPIASDGTVDVPSDAVDSLTSVGGFSLADVAAASAPDGHVEVDHDDPNASLSFGGASYARGEDGRFFVPLAAAPVLAPFGFRLITLEEVAAKLHAALAADSETGEEGEAPAEPIAPAASAESAESAPGETPADPPAA